MNIVVLGASAWLGKRLALRLAKQADNLILLGRRPEKLQSVAEESELGGKAKIYILDLADIENIQQVSKEIVTSLGQIDILLNVAGGEYVGRIKDCKPDELCNMFDSYIRGQALFLSLLLPALRQSSSDH
jgi:NADP-dependent 3-hydroxy acid dehydrogenase YdfG